MLANDGTSIQQVFNEICTFGEFYTRKKLH